MQDEDKARDEHGRDHDRDALPEQHAVGHGDSLQRGEPAHHEPAERADAGRVRPKVGAKDDRREGRAACVPEKVG